MALLTYLSCMSTSWALRCLDSRMMMRTDARPSPAMDNSIRFLEQSSIIVAMCSPLEIYHSRITLVKISGAKFSYR